MDPGRADEVEGRGGCQVPSDIMDIRCSIAALHRFFSGCLRRLFQMMYAATRQPKTTMGIATAAPKAPLEMEGEAAAESEDWTAGPVEAGWKLAAVADG